MDQQQQHRPHPGEFLMTTQWIPCRLQILQKYSFNLPQSSPKVKQSDQDIQNPKPHGQHLEPQNKNRENSFLTIYSAVDWTWVSQIPRYSFREQDEGQWKESWKWKHSAQPQSSNHINLVPNWTQTRVFLNVKLGSTTQTNKLFYRNSWNQPANQSYPPRHIPQRQKTAWNGTKTDNRPTRENIQKKGGKGKINLLFLKKHFTKTTEEGALWTWKQRDHRKITRHKTII